MSAIDTREMTKSSRILIICISIVAAATYLVLASYNYMVTPMLADLGLSTDQANLALKIPSLASLLIIFLAGRMGDRIGHRKVILVLSFPFILGCAIVSFAQGLGMVVVGMFLEGVAGTAIEIIAIGLLVAHFVTPKSRAAAFATFGVAYPAAFLIFPTLAGWLVTYMSWRFIPLIWLIGGIIVLLIALFIFPSSHQPEPLGEMWTPLLAGVLAVSVVQFISHASDFGLTSIAALLSIGVAVGSLGLLIILFRRLKDPSLSIAPLKNGATSIILVVVIIVPLLNTFFYITIAFEYMYGKSAFEAALMMMPSQLAGMLGAQYVSEPLSDRFGLKRSGVMLLLALAPVMAMALTFSATTPLWWMVLFSTLLGFVIYSADVIVLNALLSSGPSDEGGNSAAFQGSAEILGTALGVVLMGAMVFGIGQASLSHGLTEAGLPADQATSVMDQVKQNSTSPMLESTYSFPLPNGGDVSDVEKQAIADGLRFNGAVGVIVGLIAAGLFAAHKRDLDIEETQDDDSSAPV